MASLEFYCFLTRSRTAAQRCSSKHGDRENGRFSLGAPLNPTVPSLGWKLLKEGLTTASSLVNSVKPLTASMLGFDGKQFSILHCIKCVWERKWGSNRGVFPGSRMKQRSYRPARKPGHERCSRWVALGGWFDFKGSPLFARFAVNFGNCFICVEHNISTASKRFIVLGNDLYRLRFCAGGWPVFRHGMKRKKGVLWHQYKQFGWLDAINRLFWIQNLL